METNIYTLGVLAKISRARLGLTFLRFDGCSSRLSLQSVRHNAHKPTESIPHPSSKPIWPPSTDFIYTSFPHFICTRSLHPQVLVAAGLDLLSVGAPMLGMIFVHN